MTQRFTPAAAVAAALSYLVVLGWAIQNLSYDIWGVLIVVPPMALLTWHGARRMFRGPLAELFLPMMLGMCAKLAGSAVRYWVSFDAYGGTTDAQRYHFFGRQAAGAFWAGDATIGSVLPGGTGTKFVERCTAFVYSMIGSSKLAGFVVFGWFAFWGVALFVKAACIAIPQLARRRYGYLCALSPSLVYWPSSIGKEALLVLFLGMASYGLARLLAGAGFAAPLVIAAAGLTGAGLIRAHVTAIWLVGLVPALAVALIRARRGDRRARTRATSWTLLPTLAVAAVSVWAVGKLAASAISATDEQTSFSNSIIQVLRETTRRSDSGGSNFIPASISGPRDWPFAAARALTRPMLWEAHGLFQWVSALEIAGILALCALSWRHIAAVPRWIIRLPYVTLVVTVLFAGGLAYASFANLGILTRQKSLLMPFLLLLPCLPTRPSPRPSRRSYPAGRDAVTRPVAATPVSASSSRRN